MTWAGYTRWPGTGEYLKPVQDGRPILALGHWDFEELMAGIKSLEEVALQHLTSNDLIGPVTAYHQVTGAGNMAIAAQIPIKTNPARVNYDERCIYVFIIQGIEQPCALIDKCQSRDLAAKWLNEINDRADQTVPISATEIRTIKVLQHVVDHAENIKKVGESTKSRRGRGAADCFDASNNRIERSGNS